MQVGYSSDEDEAAAAAGGDKSQPSSSGKKATTSRVRHPPDSSEVHAYEVGGSGAVREVHGHMVGPDEADLIESEDSDKVGGLITKSESIWMLFWRLDAG